MFRTIKIKNKTIIIAQIEWSSCHGNRKADFVQHFHHYLIFVFSKIYFGIANGFREVRTERTQQSGLALISLSFCPMAKNEHLVCITLIFSKMFIIIRLWERYKKINLNMNMSVFSSHSRQISYFRKCRRLELERKKCCFGDRQLSI